MLYIVDVAICKNVNIKPTKRASELKYELRPWIEVQRSRKKIGEERRKMISSLAYTNEGQLIYCQSKNFRGTNRTQTMKSIETKSKTK